MNINNKNVGFELLNSTQLSRQNETSKFDN